MQPAGLQLAVLTAACGAACWTIIEFLLQLVVRPAGLQLAVLTAACDAACWAIIDSSYCSL